MQRQDSISSNLWFGLGCWVRLCDADGQWISEEIIKIKWILWSNGRG